MKTTRKERSFVYENLGNRVAGYFKEKIQQKDIAARLGKSRAPAWEK
jgi:hypothetical protein